MDSGLVYGIDLWCRTLLTRCLCAHDAVCGSGHEHFMGELLELLDCAFTYSCQMNGCENWPNILLAILNCLCLCVF